MKQLSRDKHVYVLDPNTSPAITVNSGEELMVETWDAFEGERDPAVLSATELKGGTTGPIYVNDAQPGDALKIEFLSITPKGGAAHMVTPGRGFLGEEFTQGYATIIEFQDGHAVLPTGVKLPLAPSMGLVATTPNYRQATASDSGTYGGDIDMKELVEGSVLYLPVFVPGTGVECSADTHLRVTVEKGLGITSPRALTPQHFVVLSHGEDLGAAMKQAVRDMVDFLVSEKDMAPYDAYSLLSLAGDVRVSRSFRPISPVKMMLSRQALDQLG